MVLSEIDLECLSPFIPILLLLALDPFMNQGIFYFNCWVVADFFVSPQFL